jgi:hypothetical protein
MSIQEVFTKYGRDFLGEEQCVPSLEHNLGLFKEKNLRKFKFLL